MPCLVQGREIILSGDVGDMGGWFCDDFFTSVQVIMALATIGDGNDVTVRINSGGGIAWEGSAIHAILSRYKGTIHVIVEGIAASAASVIAMAGKTVTMARGAMFMVHSPSGVTMGTAKDHQDQINCLDALEVSMATLYAAKSGQDVATCRADMQAETWMTADQAVAKGYADAVEGVADPEAAPVEPAPFPYRAYRNAPAPILALADRKSWPRSLPRAAAPTPPAPKEKGMTEPKTETAAPAEPDAAPAPVPAATEPLNPEQAGDPPPEPEDTVTETKTEPVFSRADAAEIAEICATGGAPTMTAALIREGVSAASARQRVNAAGQIKDVVALARKSAPHLAADFADKAIAAGKSVDQVKASLFDAMAARSEDPAAQVDHHKRTGAGGANHNVGDGDARAKSKANMKAELKRRGMLPKEG